MDAKHIANGVLAKDSPIGAIQNYNSDLPSVMDFTLQEALSKVFNEDDGSWDKGMIKVYDNFTNDYLYANPNNLLVFVETTTPIVLMKFITYSQIQNGDGITRYRSRHTAIVLRQRDRNERQQDKGDADIRHDFPGGWAADENNSFHSAGRSQGQNEYFDFTAKLFQWRKIAKLCILEDDPLHS
jgi:hypothetical protein